MNANMAFVCARARAHWSASKKRNGPILTLLYVLNTRARICIYIFYNWPSIRLWIARAHA